MPRKLASLASSSLVPASLAPATIDASVRTSPLFTGNSAIAGSGDCGPLVACAEPGCPATGGAIRATISVTSPIPAATSPGTAHTWPATFTVTRYSPTGSRTSRNSPRALDTARSVRPVSTSRAVTSAPTTGAPSARSTCPPMAPSRTLCARAAPSPQTPQAASRHPAATHPILQRSPQMPIDPSFRHRVSTKRSPAATARSTFTSPTIPPAVVMTRWLATSMQAVHARTLFHAVAQIILPGNIKNSRRLSEFSRLGHDGRHTQKQKGGSRSRRPPIRILPVRRGT